jgi:hypothetical protein
VADAASTTTYHVVSTATPVNGLVYAALPSNRSEVDFVCPAGGAYELSDELELEPVLAQNGAGIWGTYITIWCRMAAPYAHGIKYLHIAEAAL